MADPIGLTWYLWLGIGLAVQWKFNVVEKLLAFTAKPKAPEAPK